MTHPLDTDYLNRWLLSPRHRRALPFAGEALTPEMDVLAWMEETGGSLETLAVTRMPESPDVFVLALLAGRFKRILEAFLNSHDLGLDGRSITPVGGFWNYQLDADSALSYARYLTEKGFPLDGTLRSLEQACACPDVIEPRVIADLLATYYRAFPDCADRLETCCVPRHVRCPDPIEPGRYRGSHGSVGATVADCCEWVQATLPWAMRFFTVHGSLATEDYICGFSDFDTFAIVRSNVCESAEALMGLRRQMIGVWPYFYRLDPNQHHGVLLAAEADLGFYGAASFPLEVLAHARSVIGHVDGIDLREHDSSFEAQSALAQMAQYCRHHHKARSAFDKAFELRLFVGMVLLVPAVYCQAVGRPVYKRESFDFVHDVLSPGARATLDRFSGVRARGLLLAERRAEALPDGVDVGRLIAFHEQTRAQPSPAAALEHLGPRFVTDAFELVEDLYGAARAQWRTPDSRDTTGIPGYTFINAPVPSTLADYETAQREALDLVRELAPDVQVARFGSISAPGISDIDLLLLLPPGASIGQLDTLPSRWTELSRSSRNLCYHPPPLVVPREELHDLPALYPVFEWTWLAGDGTAMAHELVSAEPFVAQQLLALVEIATLYFLRDTLPPLLTHVVDERFLLLRLAGLRHSVAVLQAAGYRFEGADRYQEEIATLRRDWFATDVHLRRRRLIAMVREGLSLQLDILGALRDWLRTAEPGCRDLDADPGCVVAVLDETAVFIGGWTPEVCLETAERAFMATGRIFAALPAELAFLPSCYRAHPGAMQFELEGRFLARPCAGQASSAVRERVALFADRLLRLNEAGLQWGALPHWDFNPRAAHAVSAPWHEAARELVRDGSPDGFARYIATCGPQSAELREARTLIDAGRPGDALAILPRLLKRDPLNPELHYLYAFALHKGNGDRHLALAHYDQALDGGFHAFWVRYQRAALLRQMDSVELAIVDLEAAVTLEPRNAPAAIALAEARHDASCAPVRRLLADSRFADAEQALHALVEESPENGELTYLLGCAQMGGGDLDAAIRSFDRAQTSGFDRFWVCYQRGVAYARANNGPRAAADLEQALVLSPSHPGVRAALSDAKHAGPRMLVEKGQFREATVELLRSVEHDPNDAEAHYLLALCHESFNRTNLALTHYTRALALGYPEVLARLHRGALLLELGRYDGALEDAARAVSLDPTHPWARDLERECRAVATRSGNT